MSAEIITVLVILAAVIILLITEWAPLEVLALLVMGVLAVTDVVTPKEALAGFSNPAKTGPTPSRRALGIDRMPPLSCASGLIFPSTSETDGMSGTSR